jgi:hypothetical protein
MQYPGKEILGARAVIVFSSFGFLSLCLSSTEVPLKYGITDCR